MSCKTHPMSTLINNDVVLKNYQCSLVEQKVVLQIIDLILYLFIFCYVYSTDYTIFRIF